ncbi:SPOR domain-containing protein [Candidatus Finniella inopinata]|uniref:SPOR domain-containing protein n=1 Tax=Candidatus Finniella inopinata TaxID=1696036 RepID=A0A4Q7DGE2_9PROT|nr:SPOR domain-containing protein [Candidatus Finniella inopinata]RZI45215.1 hypothetical protein EQU50_08000 [Candidatus Finniella inopinata]
MARFFGGRKNQAENDFRRFEQEMYLNSTPRPTHNPDRPRPEEDAQEYVDPRFDSRSYAPPLRQENLRQDAYSQQQPPLRQQPSFRVAPPLEAQPPSFGPLRPSRQDAYEQDGYSQNRHKRPARTDELKGLRFWQDDQEEVTDDSEEWVERPSPFKFIIALMGLTVMVSILWFGYRWLSQPSPDGPVLIEAEPGPFKVKPENPGGSEIPYQDKLIYGRISPGTEAPVERLLPPPEQPMAAPPLDGQAPEQGHYDPQYAAQPAYPQQQQGYQGGPAAPAQAPYPQPQQLAPVQTAPAQPNPIQAAPYPAQPAQSAQPYPPIQAAQPVYAPQHQAQMQQPQPLPPAPVAPTPQADVAPVAPTPAAKTTPEAGFYIQLGTLPTKAAAAEELKRLRKKHRVELADYDDRTEAFETADGKKVYRALIGPFQKRNTALSKCNKLGSSCRVIQVP